VVYWLCDRDEDPEQLQRERAFAVRFLKELVSEPAYAAMWSEDVQQQLLAVLVVPMTVCSYAEFGEYVDILCLLPTIREKRGAPLLDAFLGQIKNISTDRHYDAYQILSAAVGDGAKSPILADHYISKKLLTKLNIGEEGTAMTRSLLLHLVSRVASSEQREKLLTPVLELVRSSAVLPNSVENLPASLTAAEAVLLSVSFLAHEHGAPFLAAVNEESFMAKIHTAHSVYSQLLKYVTFAVKKEVLASAVPEALVEAYSSLSNLCDILDRWREKRLLSVSVTPSWRKPRPLPHVKRARVESGTPGEASAAKYRPGPKP
jgi:hypothetical protein